MKITHVDFISVVSFGGSLKSFSQKVVGDRPGQTPGVVTLSDDGTLFKLEKHINGKLRTKYVPMTNVSGFEVEEEVKPQVKK